MEQKLTKLISILLVAILLLASSAEFISYAEDMYLAATDLERQGTSTNNQAVTVDVYYAGEKHTQTMNMEENEEKIYARIAVLDSAYLKDTVIDFSDCNFNVSDDGNNDNRIQAIEDNKVILNKIVEGETIEISLVVTPKTSNQINYDAFNKDSTVKMTGTYVNAKEREMSIYKDVVIHTNWHGEASSTINGEIVKVIGIEKDGREGLLVQTEIKSQVENNSLPVKEEKIIIDVPSIGNIEPETVRVYAKTTAGINGEENAISFNENNYIYNKEEKTLTIITKNEANADGKISWTKNQNNVYEVVMIYLEEIEEVKADLDVTTNTTEGIIDSVTNTLTDSNVGTIDSVANTLTNSNVGTIDSVTNTNAGTVNSTIENRTNTETNTQTSQSTIQDFMNRSRKNSNSNTTIQAEEKINNEAINVVGTELKLNATLESTYYNNEESYNSTSTEIMGDISVEKGTITYYEAGIVENEIAKGYMYNNKTAIYDNKKETPFTERYLLSTSYTDITDKMSIIQNSETFVTENGEEGAFSINGENYGYNKTIRVNKAEFEKILGTEGSINVISNSTIIATIDNTIEANSQGNVEVDISNYNVNNLIIETSKPIREGRLYIEIDKAVAKEVAYSTEQIQSFKEIKLTAQGISTINNNEQATNVIEDRMNLTEPTAKASADINKTNLYTLEKNENVEIKTMLEVDSADDMTYKNPVITITLPQHINAIEGKPVDILYTDELQLNDNIICERNNDGTVTLIIKTAGEITKYDEGNITNGPVVLITADIELEKLTPSSDMNVVINIKDDNGTDMTGSTNIVYSAPTGIFTISDIYNSSDNGNIIETNNLEESKEKATGEIEANSEARTIKSEKTIVNNNGNQISDVKILGRTFFQGNKDIETGEDLGSTMNIPLATEIKVEGQNDSKYTVYYSENGEATEDLSSNSNGWTQSPENLSQVKSYLIVTDDMEQGESAKIEYDATIEENLDYNETSYENYAVYYNNVTSYGTYSNVLKAGVTGLSTGEGDQLGEGVETGTENGETPGDEGQEPEENNSGDDIEDNNTETDNDDDNEPDEDITVRIEYDDDYMYICAGWNKVKVYYRDIVAVYSAANPFGYWLKSYDTRERKFILAFPLEHKKLRELFTAIEKVNPSVQIDVWWYKKQPASNNLKTVLKVGLFIIAIFAADFLFHYLTKR